MRRLVLSSLLLALPNVVRADCTRDTTRAEPRTLFGQLGVKALHVDEGGGSAPLNGSRVAIAEARLVVAHCFLPAYSVAVVGGGNMEWNETGYVAPGTANLHPSLSVRWSGVEVTRRWRDSSIFHPMVSLAAGTLTSDYMYNVKRADGTWESRVDGASHATYYTPSVGLEASLFKYMSVYWMSGTRFVGTVTTPNATGMSGAWTVLGVGVGKFR